MQIFKFITIITIICVPMVTFGYETTDQRAVRINETTALYFIDFTLGHGDHDTYVPVQAVRDKTSDAVDELGFEIREDGETPTSVGTVQAAVISDIADIEDSMYRVPQGFRYPFTLAVVLTTERDTAEADYAVKVTDLPFRLDDTEQSLNPSELSDYQTDEIELNESNDDRVSFSISDIAVELKSVEYNEVES